MTNPAIMFSLAIVVLSVTYSSSLKKDAIQTITTMMPNDDASNQGDMNDMDLSTVMSACNETFRIEMSYIEALNQSGSFPDESDRNPKCFVRCVLEKTSVVSAEGVYDVSRAIVAFSGMGGQPMDGADEAAGVCADRKETCKCESAYQFMKCLIEKRIMASEKN